MVYIEETIEDKKIILVKVKCELQAEETAEMGAKIRNKASCRERV